MINISAFCKQILAAINGESKGWVNHPVTKMYSSHTAWLGLYTACLQAYKDGYFYRAQQYSDEADTLKPSFHTELYFKHMMARLYTKSPDYYLPRFGKRQKTEINMYWNSESQAWVYYRMGKKLKLTEHPEVLIGNIISILNADLAEATDLAHTIKKLEATEDPYIIRRVKEILSIF